MPNISLLEPISGRNCPEWTCPSCKQKTLIVLKETFHERFTKESREAREREGNEWEPEWDKSVFSCLLSCVNTSCNEVVACSGIGKTGLEHYDDQGGWDYVGYYFAKNFTPTLFAFEFPEGCPDTVSNPLIKAFSLYLSHPGAAANSVRISVEELLTALGVSRANRENLHTRLLKLVEPNPHAKHAELLTAIKLLGNEGSHSDDKVDTQDITDAFEIMEYVLSDIYDTKAEKIKKIAEGMSSKFKRKK